MARIFGIRAPHARPLMGMMARASQHGYSSALQVVEVSATPDTPLAVADPRPARLAACVQGVTVVLDGAIYNRRELGKAPDDAHLIVDLYRAHGFEQMLRRLNGDFALALHDAAEGTLWLARDRLGVKPLYYTHHADMFAFASRLAPLRDLPGIGTAINRRFAAVFAASHYRYFDNAPEESPYECIAQLPAAHWLRLDGSTASTGCYWRLEDRGDIAEGEAALAERYRELLLSAVELRLAASEQPAFTLSGGMDSSSILASARLLTGAPQHAFSAVYADKTFDESEGIRPMLEHAVSQWHAVRVDDPDVFSLINRMIAVNDEPVATATWLSHFVLCEEAAREGFHALFGGLGGDELNAGEYEYFIFHFADLHHAGRTRELDEEIAQWVAHHDHPIYRKSALTAAETMARCTDARHPGRCTPDLVRMRRYYATLMRDFYDLEGFLPVMDAPFSSYLKTRSYQDLTRETAPCCLRAEDRQTQAFGLDNHVPFLDHRLIEFMFRVPGTMKIKHGVTKRLLRQAMRGMLPDATRERVKKTGWNAPAHLWFSGDGRSQLLDLIHSRAFRERGIYDLRQVEHIVEEHEDLVLSGAQRENHMMFLWQLVNLELWLRSLSAS
jgi:asparagine synthase (glutamine-hydrolysing)